MENRSYLSVKQSKKIGDYQIGRTLGQGTFGKVKEGIHLPTAQKVAIKILQKSRIANSSDLSRIKHELQILQKVKHPNIIKLLEFQQTQKNLFIITQLIQGVELFQMIVSKIRLNEDLCGIYLSQLISAIDYLHSLGICHRDIKPQNIIVTQYEPTHQQLMKDTTKMHLGLNQLKLIDFGLSKEFGDDKLLSTSCGSPCYAAPQMLSKNGRKYNATKTDIWAVGVTLHAMAMGCLPFEDDNTDRLYDLIHTGKYRLLEENSPNIPEQVKNIIADILVINPNKRISFKELNIKYQRWLGKYDSILQQYRNVRESQNVGILMDSMSKIFCIPSRKLAVIIQRHEIPSISTFFYLSWQKNLKNTVTQFYQKCLIQKQEQNQVDYQEHQGFFHLNFVFSSLQEILEFTHTHLKLKSSLENIKQFKAIQYEGTKIKIKRLRGTDLLYLAVPSYCSFDI